jgi:hypothetical protein
VSASARRLYAPKGERKRLTAELMEDHGIERLQPVRGIILASTSESLDSKDLKNEDVHVVDKPWVTFILEQERRVREGRKELDEPRRGLDVEVFKVRCEVRDGDRESREERVKAGSGRDGVDRLQRRGMNRSARVRSIGGDGKIMSRERTTIRKSAAVPDTTNLAGRDSSTRDEVMLAPNA